MTVSIPRLTLLECGLPVSPVYELARREGNAKKPVYEMHKWWARRLGTVFRALLIAATTPGYRDETESRKARRLVERFYQRGSLGGLTLLDPFMGGGTSVVESLKRGARVIGVDVDPVAWFVTKKQIETFTLRDIESAYKEVAQRVERDIRALYRTYDPRTGQYGEIINAFWVIRLRCGACRRVFDGHPHYRLGLDKENRTQDVICAQCGEIHQLALRRVSFSCNRCKSLTIIEQGPVNNGRYRCPYCSHCDAIRSQAGEGRPLSKRMFALEFTIDGDLDRVTGRHRRHLKRASRFDIAIHARAVELLAVARRRLPFPRARIFRRGRYDRRPISFGYSHYWQLFGARQLYCLSRIYQEITAVADAKTREYMLLAFSDCLAANNQLVGYAFGYRKATPLFGIHGYHVVQRPVEGNVWGNPHYGRASFSRCVAKVLLGKQYSNVPFEFAYSRDGNPVRVYLGETAEAAVASTAKRWESGAAQALLLNRSSADLRPVSDRSVDLILTDPPFYDNLPYSELSDFYFQWLRPSLRGSKARRAAPLHLVDSLFVRRKTDVQHSQYVTGLTAVMHECARVLRPDGMLVFTFHHREPAAWHALGRAIADSGFSVTAVTAVRAEGVSGFHSYDGTPKWDSVICCRTGDVRPTIGVSVDRLGSLALSHEAKWYRTHRQSVTVSKVDRASIACSNALMLAVNTRLDDIQYAALLRRVLESHPIKGVAVSIPGIRPGGRTNEPRANVR